MTPQQKYISCKNLFGAEPYKSTKIALTEGADRISNDFFAARAIAEDGTEYTVKWIITEDFKRNEHTYLKGRSYLLACNWMQPSFIEEC